MNYLNVILAAVIGYLFGCIPTGILIAKTYAGLDIQKTGSGNTGTTNVLRTLGWVPSVLTLAGDCLKGVLGALIGKYLGGEAGMVIGGLFAVIGHDYNIFLKFKGGRAVAVRDRAGPAAVHPHHVGLFADRHGVVPDSVLFPAARGRGYAAVHALRHPDGDSQRVLPPQQHRPPVPRRGEQAGLRQDQQDFQEIHADAPGQAL